MRMLLVVACLVVSAFGLSVATVAAQSPHDPAATVWEAGGSNMGECSAFLGTMQKRDDVNAIILEYGDVLGISSPGELYHVRAQQQVSLPPIQECLPRQLP